MNGQYSALVKLTVMEPLMMFTAQRPHLILAATLLAGALTTLGACGDDFVNCGAGQAREIDGERYCVYSNNLIIEGFKCPSSMLPNEVPGGVVCAPSDHSGSGLPEPLKAPFDDTVPWCVGDNCQPPPDFGPHELAPVPRSQDDFEKVYRHADYACVINKDKEATCWGPALEAADSTLPKTLSDVSDLALNADSLCSISTFGTPKCSYAGQDELYSSGFFLRMIYRDITSDGELVCALGDYSKPLNILHCGHIDPARDLPPALRVQGMHGEMFYSVDITENISGRVQAICGVREDLTVHCRSELGEFTKMGVYEQVKHWGGGSGGIACARKSARDIGGPIECWRLDDGMALPSPAGKFSQLYSAFCGFNAEAQEVQCWDQLRREAQLTPTPAPTTTLYQGQPRDFAIHMTLDELRWCAITLQGQLVCTDLTKAVE